MAVKKQASKNNTTLYVYAKHSAFQDSKGGLVGYTSMSELVEDYDEMEKRSLFFNSRA